MNSTPERLRELIQKARAAGIAISPEEETELLNQSPEQMRKDYEELRQWFEKLGLLESQEKLSV